MKCEGCIEELLGKIWWIEDGRDSYVIFIYFINCKYYILILLFLEIFIIFILINVFKILKIEEEYFVMGY